MINANALRHPKIQWELEAACWKAIEQSRITNCKLGWALVKNSKGETICHVRHSRNMKDDRKSLSFFSKDNRDITEIIIKALRNNK